ncbi:MAG: AraC family transcriptional regulator [Lachnospiraceae bacterium]
MKTILLHPDAAIHYNWCGKFESPSPEWMHLTRDLIDFEFIAVTQGVLYIADSHKEYVVKKGEYILMSPDRFQHGYQQSDCQFYWLHFQIPEDSYEVQHPKQIPEAGNIVLPAYGSLSIPERIIVLMKQLQDSDRRYHNLLLNNSLTSAIIYELYSQGSVYRKLNEPKKSAQIYNDITDYIIYHACENIRVSQIADYFGYNEKYLTTFFRRQSGISLKQFMMQAKMDAAKAELTDTNHSISQIAYNVGFSDSHNFTNAFKKITGLSPSVYRESYAKRSLFYK